MLNLLIPTSMGKRLLRHTPLPFSGTKHLVHSGEGVCIGIDLASSVLHLKLEWLEIEAPMCQLRIRSLESIQPSQGTVFSLYRELSGQKIYLKGSDSKFNGKGFFSNGGIMLFSWQELPESWPSSSCWLSTALTPNSDTSVWRKNGHLKSGLQNTREEQSNFSCPKLCHIDHSTILGLVLLSWSVAQQYIHSSV